MTSVSKFQKIPKLEKIEIKSPKFLRKMSELSEKKSKFEGEKQKSDKMSKC